MENILEADRSGLEFKDVEKLGAIIETRDRLFDESVRNGVKNLMEEDLSVDSTRIEIIKNLGLLEKYQEELREAIEDRIRKQGDEALNDNKLSVPISFLLESGDKETMDLILKNIGNIRGNLLAMYLNHFQGRDYLKILDGISRRTDISQETKEYLLYEMTPDSTGKDKQPQYSKRKRKTAWRLIQNLDDDGLEYTCRSFHIALDEDNVSEAVQFFIDHVDSFDAYAIVSTCKRAIDLGEFEKVWPIIDRFHHYWYGDKRLTQDRTIDLLMAKCVEAGKGQEILRRLIETGLKDLSGCEDTISALLESDIEIETLKYLGDESLVKIDDVTLLSGLYGGYHGENGAEYWQLAQNIVNEHVDDRDAKDLIKDFFKHHEEELKITVLEWLLSDGWSSDSLKLTVIDQLINEGKLESGVNRIADALYGDFVKQGSVMNEDLASLLNTIKLEGSELSGVLHRIEDEAKQNVGFFEEKNKELIMMAYFDTTIGQPLSERIKYVLSKCSWLSKEELNEAIRQIYLNQYGIDADNVIESEWDQIDRYLSATNQAQTETASSLRQNYLSDYAGWYKEQPYILRRLIWMADSEDPRNLRKIFKVLDSRKISKFDLFKSGSGLSVLTGELGGIMINTIKNNHYDVWQKVHDLGLPVAPILKKGIGIIDKKDESSVRVYSRFCGLNISEYVAMSEDPIKELEWLSEEVDAINTHLEDLGIRHEHPHYGNFTIEFIDNEYFEEQLASGRNVNTIPYKAEKWSFDPKTYRNNPDKYQAVVRLIDWDAAKSADRLSLGNSETDTN